MDDWTETDPWTLGWPTADPLAVDVFSGRFAVVHPRRWLPTEHEVVLVGGRAIGERDNPNPRYERFLANSPGKVANILLK